MCVEGVTLKFVEKLDMEYSEYGLLAEVQNLFIEIVTVSQSFPSFPTEPSSCFLKSKLTRSDPQPIYAKAAQYKTKSSGQKVRSNGC